MQKLLEVCFVGLICTAVLFACGGSSLTPAGSSVSVDITEPSTTTNVDVTAPIVATITDDNHIGITVPSLWSDVFNLHVVGTTTNLCTDSNITYDSVSSPQTITCTPDNYEGGQQYGLSISGLTDANGVRIDPASMAFETGNI